MGLLDRRSDVREISEVVPLTRRLIRDPCGAGPRGTRLRSWRRPTWLLNAHEDLDRAVFAAYGWPPELSDEEVLLELLTLNLERAKTHEESRLQIHRIVARVLLLCLLAL